MGTMRRQPFNSGDIVILRCKHIVCIDIVTRTFGGSDWSTNCKECGKWVRIRAMATREQKLQWMNGRLQNANGAKAKSANVETGQIAYSKDGSTP